jgi:transcriptional regulator GlxA family with amidase domain
MSVHEVASAVCLSERQLSRRFETRVGVSPKVFARVMRLQRATGAITSGATVSAAAELAGYADQAHFTREARALALVTPRILASELVPSVTSMDVSDSFKTLP